MPSSIVVLVEPGKWLKASMIESESNSSSSSSLVYDFRSTKDPFRVNCDWFLQSPKIYETEFAGGGIYAMGSAAYGKCMTESSPEFEGS